MFMSAYLACRSINKVLAWYPLRPEKHIGPPGTVVTYMSSHMGIRN